MEEDDDVDIAAAMGFASFGGTKKRKFDHTNAPKAKAGASGANSTELGVRTKKAATTDEKEFEDPTTEDACCAGQPQPHSPISKPNTAQNSSAASGLAAYLARGQTLPDKPPSAQESDSASTQNNISATETISFGGPPISRAELNALRFGVKNENGDTAYFLPSFLEDPWEKLTKKVGVGGIFLRPLLALT